MYGGFTVKRLVFAFLFLFPTNMLFGAEISDRDQSLFGRIKDAMGSAANSVIQTVKSDLGFGDEERDPDQVISLCNMLHMHSGLPGMLLLPA